MTDSKDSTNTCLDKIVDYVPRVLDKIDNTIQFSLVIPETIYQFYIYTAKTVYRATKTRNSLKKP